MSYTKPLPVPDPVSAPFWAGCRNGQLLLQRCTDCGRFRFPAATYCPHCHSNASDWVASGGRGRVFSWIVVRHPVPADVYVADVPYVVALIELDEGVRVASNVIGCDVAAVRADMPVEVVFDAVTPEITLPRFRPIGAPR